MIGENGHGAFGGFDQAETQQRVAADQVLQGGLELETRELEGQGHHMDLLVRVHREGGPGLQLGHHEGVERHLVGGEGRKCHRRRLVVHVKISELFVCRSVHHPEAAPSASSTKNLQDHLNYQDAVKRLEHASRDDLLKIARQMAYDLMVVQPEMRRRLVAMDMGSLARGAQRAVRDRRGAAEEQ